MKKAALHNLGCKVNAYETEAMEELLVKAGYEIVNFDEKADVYVVNTCSVTNIADRKSRQMIHKCKKTNPFACVVATGCYIQNFGKDIPKDLGCDIILGNNKKTELVEKLNEYFGQSKDIDEPIIDYLDINNKGVAFEKMHITKDSEHTRAFVKVQDGCNQFCTYCIIPYARGRIRSRQIEDVIEEVTELGAAGYQEIVVTGIHLSSYGSRTDYSLIDLIEAIAAVDSIKRIRIGSLEPQIVTEDFAKRLFRVEKICPHFHLSMQSGCDSVLKRMNRKYTCDEYKAGCMLLRKYFDNPAITTDVITGFPGESEEEFALTESFVQVFPYSKREGTKAASMPGQLTNAVKKQRSARLIAISNQATEAYLKAHLKKELEVLFEELTLIDGREYFVGFSKEYIKCLIPARDGMELKNVIVKAKAKEIISAGQYILVEI